MLQLVIKDFALQKKIILFLLLFVLGFSIAFVAEDRQGSFNAFFLYIVAVPIYNFVGRTGLEEEKNNTLRLVDSLPVSRENIVTARYVSIFLFSVMNLAIFAVVDYVFRFFAFENTDNFLRDFVMELLFILILTIVNSIYLPFMYRLGYKKTAIISTLVIVGIFGFIGAVTGGIGGSAPGKTNVLMKLFSSMNLATVVIAVIAVYIVSMQVSIVLFKKRNLY